MGFLKKNLDLLLGKRESEKQIHNCSSSVPTSRLLSLHSPPMQTLSLWPLNSPSGLRGSASSNLRAPLPLLRRSRRHTAALVSSNSLFLSLTTARASLSLCSLSTLVYSRRPECVCRLCSSTVQPVLVFTVQHPARTSRPPLWRWVSN